jgi:hypothetical protein
MAPDEFLTPEEFAARFRIGVQTIYNRGAGVKPFISKMGGGAGSRLRVNATRYQEYLESGGGRRPKLLKRSVLKRSK